MALRVALPRGVALSRGTVLGSVVMLTLASGCGGVARETGAEAGGEAATGAPTATTSSAATTGIVTLTGCLVRDTVSNELTLANVATAGAPVAPADAASPADEDRVARGGREGSGRPDAAGLDVEAQARLAAASSYRLIVEADETEELSAAVGKRVTVRGQLAHPAPTATSPRPDAAEAPDQAPATATGATVRGTAGELRALRVQAVRAVGDDCG